VVQRRRELTYAQAWFAEGPEAARLLGDKVQPEARGVAWLYFAAAWSPRQCAAEAVLHDLGIPIGPHSMPA
jgi:hypothetical protein